MVKIIVDHREFKSLVARVLFNLDAELEPKTLPSGDYQVSDEVCVERKELSDFTKSIMDKRLFSQLKQLKKDYKKPVLMIEGDGSLYSSNIHPNAVRGALASIAIDYQIPILWTESMEDTAQTIYYMARREQEGVRKEFHPHGSKKPMSIRQAQEYIVSAIPQVGPSIAKNLLKKFTTVKSIVNACEEELKKIDKIGPKKARTIKQIFEAEYGETEL